MKVEQKRFKVLEKKKKVHADLYHETKRVTKLKIQYSTLVDEIKELEKEEDFKSLVSKQSELISLQKRFYKVNSKVTKLKNKLQVLDLKINHYKEVKNTKRKPLYNF